jgi:hypothetical protein
MAIPPFNVSGVLPPFLGANPVHMATRSPYKSNVAELCASFATTAQRVAILDGFLQHRAALNGLGFVSGFAWCDGSFVEDAIPNDLDVVVFARRPVLAQMDAQLQLLVQQNPEVFLPAQAKLHYRCDVYFVDLDLPTETVAALTHYWFGLFSHRRVTGEWKGMIEVQLHSPMHDALGAATLAAWQPPQQQVI